MISFFLRGGQFMWLMLILAIVIFGLTVMKVVEFISKRDADKLKLERGVNAIFFWGGISAVLGFFAHYLGVYYAMEAITAANDISPAIVAEGYAMSLITILTGLFIFLFSAVIWFGLRWWLKIISH